MLACAGEGSWAEVALDGFALITFGMGRVFAKAAEGGFTAARAAGLAKVAADVNSGDRALSEAGHAEDLAGVTARDARAALTDAKANLAPAGWGKAVVKGLNPVELARGKAADLTEAVKSFHWSGSDFGQGAKSVLHNPGGAVRFGDAGAGKAAQQFGNFAHEFPQAVGHAGVEHWTSLAKSAQCRFYVTVGTGTGADLFNKASDAFPGAPVLHQWHDFKDWAKHEV
jgi:hypothetical protein